MAKMQLRRSASRSTYVVLRYDATIESRDSRPTFVEPGAAVPAETRTPAANRNHDGARKRIEDLGCEGVCESSVVRTGAGVTGTRLAILREAMRTAMGGVST